MSTSMSTVQLPVGVTATTITYDMAKFLTYCTTSYRDIVGTRNYATPFLADDQKDALAGAFGSVESGSTLAFSTQDL